MKDENNEIENEKNEIEDEKNKMILVLNKMFLYQNLSYIEGYINIYCKKNKNENINYIASNNIQSYIYLSNQLNEHWQYFAKNINIKNDKMKFVKMKDMKFPINHDNKNSDSCSKNNNKTNFVGNLNNKKFESQDNNIDNNLNNNNISKIEKENISFIDSNSEKDISIFQDNEQYSFNSNFSFSMDYLEEENYFKLNAEVDENQLNIDDKNELEMSESLNDLKPEKTIKEEKDNSTTITIFFKNKTFKNLSYDSYKKFSEILSEFLKGNNINCNYYYIAILKHKYDYKLINKEKTLIENGVEDNDEILLFNNSFKERDPNLEEDNSEILNFLLKDYQAKKFSIYQRQLHDAIKKGIAHPKFEKKMNREDLISFLMDRADNISPGIKILEHPDQLVCCLSKDNWICGLCNGKYDSKKEKFYCSVCNFSLCQECRKLKNYDGRKAIKNNINDFNEKDWNYCSEYYLPLIHEHKLKYCKTSRNYFGETFWNCNKCGENRNTWGFYCTLCDFDLCVVCLNKHISKK